MGAENIRADGTLAAKTRWTMFGAAFVDVNAASADVAWVVGESLFTDASCFLAFDVASGILTALNAITWSYGRGKKQAITISLSSTKSGRAYIYNRA